jgi:hypothetical protein
MWQGDLGRSQLHQVTGIYVASECAGVTGLEGMVAMRPA